jgi:DNA repair protein RecO (recombination protein O)
LLYKTQGIVFHTTDYADTSIVAKIYTAKFGLQSYLINSVRSSKAKNKSGFFQPLTILDLVVYHKGEKGLHRIREINFAHRNVSIPFNTIKSTQAMFMAEVAYRSIREEESNAALFQYLHDAIIHLDSLTNEAMDFHLFFMIQLSGQLGFQPTSNYSQGNCFFDLQEGSFLDREPHHPNYLNMSLSAVFFNCLQVAFVNGRIALNNIQRIELLKAMMTYYALHLPGDFKVQSFEVLRELLHG